MTTEVSAGGIVYNTQSGQTLWLLVKHSGYHKWVFPKGRVEPGEDLQQTAVREVQEESGVVAKIIDEVPNSEHYIYTFNGEKISKTVHYFLMEYVSGDIGDHDFETEDVQWVSVEDVMQMLGFDAAKKTFQTARDMLEAH
jgi:8-oxo-dGTP pyrophosphatase MutT (NUDIX family)